MDVERASIVFSSEIRALTEQNSSFDKGILRVCYTGVNRNKSCISKETFEKCISSIYNCPIVCRYDRETDTIGAHDVDVVRNAEGDLKMINTTQPVGVIPTGANYWWENVEEDDGAVHEYLCVEALLWKRQEAYEKIRSDGIVEESMEISIKSSKMEDGILHIYDFEFTAFCLLGTAVPCFESASLELFALDEFKVQLAEMMDDLKTSFSLMQSSNEADIDTTFSSKGGSTVLNNEIEVIEDQTQVDVESASDEVVDAAFEVEECDPASDEQIVEHADESADESQAEFALEGQIRQLLCEALEGAEKVATDWGEWPRYWMVDYDHELNEVYAFDEEDGKLYGFAFAMNGDNVVVDFASKSRKKWVIQDFDEGEHPALFSRTIELLNANCAAVETAWSEKYNQLSEETDALKEFKQNAEADDVFALFGDLNGLEAFEDLKNDHASFSKEDLEEKCYAIRGRYGANAQFSLETPTSTKVVVEIPSEDDEPYGGLFIEYGSK